jgi:hypothetical protein
MAAPLALKEIAHLHPMPLVRIAAPFDHEQSRHRLLSGASFL